MGGAALFGSDYLNKGVVVRHELAAPGEPSRSLENLTTIRPEINEVVLIGQIDDCVGVGAHFRHGPNRNIGLGPRVRGTLQRQILWSSKPDPKLPVPLTADRPSGD